MGKSSDKVKETSQERTLAEVSAEKLNRYNTVFRPLEEKLTGGIVNAEGKRTRAMGVAAGSQQQSFGRVNGQLEGRMAAGRVAPGSGKFVGMEGGIASDRAKAVGLGLNDASESVNRDRISGMQALIGIGQGKSANAMAGFEQEANRAQSQAEMDAAASRSNRAAGVRVVGTVAGMGLDAYDAWHGTPTPAGAPTQTPDANGAIEDIYGRPQMMP